eukprot:TRINITY_DN32935_c0_g1_i1.p1 TRINITY_DN32935_c0_g1~~TRINITY_DN32935_c0_g1_i1.p1  ORF type:complete len:362 (+),score=60.71 TRINITY_DN32935_c0_g1_i1:59-1087(+)
MRPPTKGWLYKPSWTAMLVLLMLVSHVQRRVPHLDFISPVRGMDQIQTLQQTDSDSHIVVASDSTGHTASLIVDRVLEQFGEENRPRVTVVPKVSTAEELMEVVQQVSAMTQDVMLVGTFVDAKMAALSKSLCHDRGVKFLELMNPLIDEFGDFFASKKLPGQPPPEWKVNQIVNHEFIRMMDATKFALQHANGFNAQDWGRADVILLGPSRVGKHPVSLHLAQRGVKVATVTISSNSVLPAEIKELDPARAVLLTVEQDRLQKLREARIADLSARHMDMVLEEGYATAEQVREDLELAHTLHRAYPEWAEPIDTSFMSVEECASMIYRKFVARRARRRKME